MPSTSTSPTPRVTPMFLLGRSTPAGRAGSPCGSTPGTYIWEEQARHQSHMSLVLARLRRESAWAAALSAHASLAADGISRADLNQANTMPIFVASTTEIQGPVLSGVRSDTYFSHVGIGWPARPLVPDTSSRDVVEAASEVGGR
ncbi:hypothetical protein CFC21_001723 [Triticum aestivum]|uniref:Uncharacterized protein n=1 Tax=Triticum aestivum TaxID=4565 RepID=A0A3B5XYL9_WHEAT|nr:hypothetical protein CFC21_001723 [Triticum aestivum]